MLVILRTHDAVAISARVKPQSKCAIRSREASMLSGFKQFMLRGNVGDMAVGVVIGAAFTTVVTAFTKDLRRPLIAAIAGRPAFSAISPPHRGSLVPIGAVITRAC